MLKLIKWLFYLAVLGFVALVGYAYIGPFFGADFSPPSQQIREGVTLQTDAAE